MWQVENTIRTSIEDELRVAKLFKRSGIRIVLLDMDDTICSTRLKFQNAYKNVCSIVDPAQKDWPAIMDVIAKHNALSHQTHHVNRDRWNLVAQAIGQELNLCERMVEQTIQSFRDIFTSKTHFLPGAENGLAFLGKIGIEAGIVTHADSTWTWNKFQDLNLERFFKWDNVFMVDVNGPKNSLSWLAAMQYFGNVTPSEVLGIGDSPKNDIMPLISLGARAIFVNDGGPIWSEYVAKLPECIATILSLKDIRNLT